MIYINNMSNSNKRKVNVIIVILKKLIEYVDIFILNFNINSLSYPFTVNIL